MKKSRIVVNQKAKVKDKIILESKTNCKYQYQVNTKIVNLSFGALLKCMSRLEHDNDTEVVTVHASDDDRDLRDSEEKNNYYVSDEVERGEH